MNAFITSPAELEAAQAARANENSEVRLINANGTASAWVSSEHGKRLTEVAAELNAIFGGAAYCVETRTL